VWRGKPAGSKPLARDMVNTGTLRRVCTALDRIGPPEGRNK